MEWWEDEQFWRDLMPYLFSPSVMERTEQDLEDILDRTNLPDGGRILDVGCGVGRLMLPLVQQGYELVGVDICDAYRRRLRAIAAERGLEVDVRARNALELGIEDESPFDLVMDVFAVVGYFDDPVGDVRAVSAFRESLKSGGQVFIATRHPQASNGRFKHSSPGGYCIEERRYERTSQQLFTQWTVTGAVSRVHRSAVRLYSADDLKGLLEVCGFEDVQLYEHLSFERNIVVGTAP